MARHRLLEIGRAGPANALLVAMVLLLFHGWVQKDLGIPLTAPLASLLPAFVILSLSGPKAEHLLRKVDYDVLLFFIGLFIVVGGLEKTGAIQSLANLGAEAFRDRPITLVSTLLWFSAVVSAVVDNVPLALSMGYVIRDMAGQAGVPALSLMVWAVSLGTDIGGNGTPIGASANVVAYAALEKKDLRIGWGRWMYLAVLPTVVALLICNFGLAVKHWVGFF